MDLDEAVAFHRSLPRHKQLAPVLRRAAAEDRCLTQPRGGFGTLDMQIELIQTLDRDGLADVVPTTTDSYTRNEQFELAQKGIEESERAGRSMLNGLPIVNYGISSCRRQSPSQSSFLICCLQRRRGFATTASNSARPCTGSRTRTVIFVSWTRPRCPFPTIPESGKRYSDDQS